MPITLTFACGCSQQVADADTAKDTIAPRCTQHGEWRITRVDAPPPRFRGVAARGPLAVKE